jgi:hypothetical protein
VKNARKKGDVHILTSEEKSERIDESPNYEGLSTQAKGMVFFYLLVPVFFMASYFAGEIWFLLYPSSIALTGVDEAFGYIYYPTICIFIALVIVSPLFILLAVLRRFCKFPFYWIKKIVCGVLLCIWVIILVFYANNPFELLLIRLYKNNDPIFIVCTIAFLAIMLKSCFVILVYAELKQSVKKDFICCTALCVVYVIVCIFFIWEGGLIYLAPYSEVVPFSEKSIVTEDFPNDKLAMLRSFLKFSYLSGYGYQSFFPPEKEISYEDFLTMAAISPAIFKAYHNFYYPKFYVSYWTNEILYPLSDDLAQKEYSGPKLIVSSERINDHFYRRESAMAQDISLASEYLSILYIAANGKP